MFYVLLYALLVNLGESATSTPIAQVVTLLKDLSSKIAAEGQKEASQYDKFSCFCKEQADQKQYAIEKSDKIVNHLKVETNELKADEALLENQIIDLNHEIEKLEDRIKQKTEHRTGQYDAYLQTSNDLKEAIRACSSAIDALKNSKKEMRGAKLDFVQVTSGLMKVVQRQPLLATPSGAATLLLKLDQQADPNVKFEYHSNDIIATLEELHSTFLVMKNGLDEDEFWGKSAFEDAIAGLSREKTLAHKAMEERTATASTKQEQIADRLEQIGEQEADRMADWKFVSRLKNQCEEAASMFDQRSNVRSSELTTLTKVIERLQEGAVANYQANTKLVGMQMSAVSKATRDTSLLKDGFGRKTRKMPSSTVTLVQLGSADHHVSHHTAPLRSVSLFLSEKADQTGSEVLSSISARVALIERTATVRSAADAPDHFDKIRGLIQDLIAKLKADMISESDQKHNCDEGIKKATGNRDKAKSEIEVATAGQTVLQTNKNKVEEHNQELARNIADLKKAMKEASELTAADVETLTEQTEMLKAGIGAVDYALTLLADFYSGTLLLQASKDHSPETPTEKPTASMAYADSEGNTVDDIAPTMSKTEYVGAQSESEGVIGILDVILDDFKTSLRRAGEDMAEAESSERMFLKDSNDDISQKIANMETNDGTLDQINEDLLDEEQALKDSNSLLESALKALENYHTMCVKSEETWEERKQKRQDEIEALKSALDVLEKWQR